MNLLNSIGSYFKKDSQGWSFGDAVKKLSVIDNTVLEIKDGDNPVYTFEYEFQLLSGTIALVNKGDVDNRYELRFTKNTAFNKNFGTTAGTVAEGNDSRINNGQTAFNWGNHAGLYRPVSWVPTWNDVTGKPTTFTPSEHVHGNITNGGTIGTTAGLPIITGVSGILQAGSFGVTAGTFAAGNDSRILNGQTAFGWGNHAGLYRPITWVPTWNEVTGKPTTFEPSAHTHAASDINSGVLAVARLGTGTGSNSNFLRGDGTWNAVAWVNIASRPTLFPPEAHTHSIEQVTNLTNELANRANINHTHLWQEILNRPDFNNTVNVLEINANSLSGTGTIEEQVRNHINANMTINRQLSSSALFIKLVGYNPINPNPDPNPNPSPGTPGTTSIANGLRMYYDFASSNWSASNNTQVRNFADQYSSGVSNGNIFGPFGRLTDNGGIYRFVASEQRYFNTNMNLNALGISSNDFSLVYVMRSFTDLSGDKFVFGESNYSGLYSSMHSGFRNNFIFHDHFASGSSHGPILLNTWYHVVITQTYNAAGPSAVRFYINGILVRTENLFFLRGNTTMLICKWQDTYFTFDLGLCMIYNRVISASEVTTLFDEQKGRFGL